MGQREVPAIDVRALALVIDAVQLKISKLLQMVEVHMNVRFAAQL